MKKRIVLTGVLLFSMVSLGGLSTEARNIGYLTKFKVTKNGNDTSSVKKLNSSNTVINLQDTSGGKQVRVRTRVNSKDLGGTTVWTGTRQSYSDNSAKNQYPYLRLNNPKIFSDNFTIYGSWSPDSY